MIKIIEYFELFGSVFIFWMFLDVRFFVRFEGDRLFFVILYVIK